MGTWSRLRPPGEGKGATRPWAWVQEITQVGPDPGLNLGLPERT